VGRPRWWTGGPDACKECQVRIFVGNLSRDASDADLQALFQTHGQVTKVEIVRDKYTGDPRGFGFVEMPTEAEAKNAIQELNKKEFKGRDLTVNEARPRERSGGGEGGRGGEGGGGGGGRRGGRW
jgi:cold-inducible RNA-binding protein